MTTRQSDPTINETPISAGMAQVVAREFTHAHFSRGGRLGVRDGVLEAYIRDYLAQGRPNAAPIRATRTNAEAVLAAVKAAAAVAA